jgi:hypothetical protein
VRDVLSCDGFEKRAQSKMVDMWPEAVGERVARLIVAQVAAAKSLEYSSFLSLCFLIDCSVCERHLRINNDG